MKIAIIGSGRMGGALGRIWSHCGHDVTFSYSRSGQRLESIARNAGAACGSVADAVQDADLVLLAVHWSRVEDALGQAGNLSGKIILTCCVPLDLADQNLVVGTDISGVETLAKAYPQSHWVGAFNTSPSESLPLVYSSRNGKPRPQLMFYGDDQQAKLVAQELIREVGFEPLDLGGLENARFVEPFAMVTAVLAYEKPGGAALTYRFEKL